MFGWRGDRRPGLAAFLARMSTLYEMHIYTMGSHPYARAVAKAIDPTGAFFGNRILSRDTSAGALSPAHHRRFPHLCAHAGRASGV
jgi:RNA polymerase II subunit A C-terminal domain phosphatase